MTSARYFIWALALIAAAPLFIAPPNSVAATTDVSVTLTPSVPSPQMLGTPVTWTATLQNAVVGHTYDFRFTVSWHGSTKIVRDFGPNNVFQWVPYKAEGFYMIGVFVRDTTSQPFITFPPVGVVYTINPWVSGTSSLVNPTTHPLVALFSAPSCPTGNFMQVRFQIPAATTSMTTSPIACLGNFTSNFYVAGMMPNTQYLMHWEQLNGQRNVVKTGSDLTFTTGSLPTNILFPAFTVNTPPSAQGAAYPVVLFSFISINPNTVYVPTATDLAGNIIWYLPNQAFLARSEVGGGILTVQQGSVAEYDLVGNVVVSTNLSIVNEQLTAKGYPTITAFHHEARRLSPSNNILVIAGRDVVSTTAQGGTPTTPVDILGDMVLVLDQNMQLVWAWDSFAHEDINRVATLNDVCAKGNPGCPPFNPNFTTANDWLHSNSAQLTADGNILISHRSQDLLVKINYANGTGDGHVIWRLGDGGDFTLLNPPATTCANPGAAQWFSHQHDGTFQFETDTTGVGTKILTLFDDGNTRQSVCDAATHSRGVVMFMAENARQVALGLNGDLGTYSYALGSGQLLAFGGTITGTFDSGALNSPSPHSQFSEIDMNGNILYQLQASAWSYRTYRMKDLYNPTLP